VPLPLLKATQSSQLLQRVLALESDCVIMRMKIAANFPSKQELSEAVFELT
jgi:hypothetical protein